MHLSSLKEQVCLFFTEFQFALTKRYQDDGTPSSIGVRISLCEEIHEKDFIDSGRRVHAETRRQISRSIGKRKSGHYYTRATFCSSQRKTINMTTVGAHFKVNTLIKVRVVSSL